MIFLKENIKCGSFQEIQIQSEGVLKNDLKKCFINKGEIVEIDEIRQLNYKDLVLHCNTTLLSHTGKFAV